MEVYLDLAVILNFLVDFLLLLGTNRISGYPLSPARCALAGLLGSVHSSACLLRGFRFLGGLHWRMTFLFLMCSVAFGWNPGMVRRSGIFLLLRMALGGASVSLGRGGSSSLVLAAMGICLLCYVGFGGGAWGQEYVPVKLRYGEKTLSLLALRDTGNTLRDPVSGEQVLIISGDAAEKLTGLTPAQLRSPLETLTHHPLPGLRLIPYRAVGQTCGLLLALRFHNVTIGSREQSAVVAFAPEGLGEHSVYQALTGGII